MFTFYIFLAEVTREEMPMGEALKWSAIMFVAFLVLAWILSVFEFPKKK